MSDTTTTTAAEVMGWNVHNPHRSPKGMGDVEAWECQECGQWISERRPRDEQPQCPSPWNQHPKPTPDDMLDYLSARDFNHAPGFGYDVQINRHHYGDTIVNVYCTHGGPDPGEFRAKTLHAALEQAVIAVGRAG